MLAEDQTWDPLIPLLQQIIAGARDRTLAEHPDLNYQDNYQDTAELHVLLDQLERAGR